jgi:hypothetical protein
LGGRGLVYCGGGGTTDHVSQMYGPCCAWTGGSARGYRCYTLYQKYDSAWLRSQCLHSCIYERMIYSQYRSAYLTAAKYADRSWEYINCSQIHECGNWETEHYNFVLEIMRTGSFIYGIHKSEPDIYIGFPPALHLQHRL